MGQEVAETSTGQDRRKPDLLKARGQPDGTGADTTAIPRPKGERCYKPEMQSEILCHCSDTGAIKITV